MEERSIGKLPQHGHPLGVHDLSRGTVSNVGPGQVKRSGPLAVAKGWNSTEMAFDIVTDKSNRWGSLTGRDTTSASTK